MFGCLICSNLADAANMKGKKTQTKQKAADDGRKKKKTKNAHTKIVARPKTISARKPKAKATKGCTTTLSAVDARRGAHRARVGRGAPVKYASDCSGIDAAVVALEKLKCAVDHQWASDCFPPCRAILEHNFSIGHVLNDVMQTPTNMSQPDLYTSGFPCQPYSTAGLRAGCHDSRSTPLWGVVQRIEKSLPKSFILENVAAFVSPSYAKVYDWLVASLCGITDKNRRAYDLHVKVLDSQHHGSPQHRPRVFFVGVLRSCKKFDFKWPADLLEAPSLETILDDATPGASALPTSATGLQGILQAYQDIVAQGHDPEVGPWVANIMNSKRFGAQVRCDMLPCLTRTRGTQSGFWLFHRGRMLTLNELARCQGFPADRLQLPAKGATERQLGGMYGNAINVDTILRIITRLLPAIGIATHMRDPFGAACIPAGCL